MISVSIRFADSLKVILPDASLAVVELSQATLRSAFDRLEAERPGTLAHLADGAGKLKPYLSVICDGVIKARLDDTPLASNSDVFVLSAFAGG